MNRLNLFHHYSQNDHGDPSENNLSRALAICLRNDGLFLSEFIRHIVNSNEKTSAQSLLNDLYSLSNDKPTFSVELQVETKSLIDEHREPELILAIAMTTRDLDMSTFASLKATRTKENKNITDIVVHLQNAVFIIEVKKSAEDCRQQLFNQLSCFSNRENVLAASFSWEQILTILLRVHNIYCATGFNSLVINDFIQLLDSHYADWFPPVPFANLTFHQDMSSVEGKRLQRRLYQTMEFAASVSGYPVRYFEDRTIFAIDFAWAREVRPCFAVKEGKQYLALQIWPANTKGQGHSIYRNPNSLAWTRKNSIIINSVEYELQVRYEVKFCHFNRFVSQIIYDSPEELTSPLHTTENFNRSGAYGREKWGDVADLMDSHFPSDLNWRDEAAWQRNFLESERTYLTFSLGFEVCVFIPYSELQQLDKNELNYQNVGRLLLDGLRALRTLID